MLAIISPPSESTFNSLIQILWVFFGLNSPSAPPNFHFHVHYLCDWCMKISSISPCDNFPHSPQFALKFRNRTELEEIFRLFYFLVFAFPRFSHFPPSYDFVLNTLLWKFKMKNLPNTFTQCKYYKLDKFLAVLCFLCFFIHRRTFVFVKKFEKNNNLSHFLADRVSARLDITLSREVKSYLLENYLPSTLFTIISWGSFLIIPTIVPGKFDNNISVCSCLTKINLQTGRMVLLVTTLLSLVTMFDTVRNNSPDALELKCIEVLLYSKLLLKICITSTLIWNVHLHRFGFCVARFSYFSHWWNISLCSSASDMIHIGDVQKSWSQQQLKL